MRYTLPEIMKGILPEHERKGKSHALKGCNGPVHKGNSTTIASILLPGGRNEATSRNKKIKQTTEVV